MIKRLYHWTMEQARSPHAVKVLFLIALAESSFFPIPPDLLLIPMAMAIPASALSYAGWCTLGSVIGGAIGYGIGYGFWQVIGQPIIEFYGAAGKYDQVQAYFHQYDVWIVAIAGFSPIPYKLFTITAGALHANFPIFILTSLLSRGARFYLVAGLLKWGGDRFRKLVEDNLNLLVTVITILVVVGFLVIKW
ncbi:YqaA family protein, partial [Magnetococcales bacterium HHB-1]